MPGLVLPASVTVRVTSVSPRASGAPQPVAGAVVGVRTADCARNNYQLGPFFTDATGVAALTRPDLERAVRAELATGIMDYGPLEQCDAEVEIALWPAEAVRSAIRARRETWTRLLPGEEQAYDSIHDLIQRYERAPNLRLTELPPAIRDRWAEPTHRAAHSFVVFGVAPT